MAVLRQRLVVLCALVSLGLCALAGCGTLSVRSGVEPVSSEASAAFEAARAWARSEDPLARERAREAATRARELALDWVAPRRMLDALDTEDLLGIEALEARREELARAPDDGVALYLVGRLEGDRGAAHFERAARVAPLLSWAHHGLGWVAAQRLEFGAAAAHSSRALELARDPFERTYFTSALARYHVLAEQPRKALEVLLARLKVESLAPLDRIELGVQAASIELSMYFQPEYQRGWERALELLRASDLSEEEVEDLVRRMRVFRGSEAALLELQLALAARPGAARDRARAEILLEERPSALALGLLRRAGHGAAKGSGPLLRAARFAAGQFGPAVDEWLADLPKAVLDPAGLPSDARLARVVELARACEVERNAERTARLGDALIRAGWFREARSAAAALAVFDLERALALDDDASAAQQLLADLQRVSIERQHAPAARRAQPQAPESLDEMLDSMAEVFARANLLRGGETDVERMKALLRASPRVSYAGLATLVHPGPVHSRADESAGLGARDSAVPGLAALLDELGRFGLFGKVLGEDVDGTILARVAAQPRSGEHLGVPWSGMVVWCEGADLRSRAGRLGAEISGAALHEGYWVDLEALRHERAPWVDFEKRMWGTSGAERIERALATRGLLVRANSAQREELRRERRDVSTSLGSADRLRLAVLWERRADARAGVSLDELLEATAVHEEAHLCDRTRFLPLRRNLGRIAAFALRSGLSGEGISRRLEYRAQLVALCCVSDPRVPLVSVLRSVESRSDDVTPHGDAYRELLVDLVAVLDAELERDPSAWPEISPERVLVQQFHRLSAESVRRIARELARREGLFER
ncbi:MAG: hypothetical protein FJ298_09600 [Planctomycetes bacterium]|nr:hypothetical protein [Planctomycetota bacterium]